MKLGADSAGNDRSERDVTTLPRVMDSEHSSIMLLRFLVARAVMTSKVLRS